MGQVVIPQSYPLPNANSWNQRELITDKQLQVAINDFDSDEFQILYDMFENELPDLPNDVVSLATDSPHNISNRLNEVHISRQQNLRNFG